MNHSRASQLKTYHHYPQSVSFGFHTAEDIKKISVVEVINSETFNEFGHPTKKGLYDPLMGPASDRDGGGECGTCSLNLHKCPGHYGHIQLPLPVFHPLFQRQVVNLLKMTCPTCHKLCASENEKALLKGQLDLLNHGFVTEAQQLVEFAEHSDEEDDDINGNKKRNTPNKKKKKKKSSTPEKGKAKIEAIVSKILGGNRSVQEEEPTRTVESLRHTYLKAFQDKLKASKCVHIDCGDTWGKLQIYKSQIVYSIKGEGGVEVVQEEEEKEEEEKTAKTPKTPKTPKKPKKKKEKIETNQKILNPQEARDHLRATWKMDKDVLCHLYPVLFSTKCDYPTDIFFLEIIPVIPCKFRPVNFLEGRITENGQTMILREVVINSFILKLAREAYINGIDSLQSDTYKRMVNNLARPDASYLEKFHFAWQQLQNSVDMIADASKDTSNRNLTGFKQVIEKKEGLFRMHMMGKRVDFAARSVITPDPNLDVEEVGVPDCFAKKLTYRVPVTSWNCLELKELVRNGPNIYPGAQAIEDENGLVTNLTMDIAGREALAKTLLTPAEANDRRQSVFSSDASKKKNEFQRGLFKPKIVHRHLQSGDVMLINRQPTLHKPSVMAHKARVLMGEKTLRLHYANCKAYNADFDGDEMNAHFPQNEVARSEAYNIVGVAHQYLVPKDGTPLSGLIQDHMISGVKLSIRGQFFNRADYQQLVFSALGGHLYEGVTKLLPPTILKPVTMWSGKQILSTVIMNLTPKGKPLINMNSTAKISVKDWQTVEARPWKAGGSKLKNAIDMSESEVIFRHGELLCGVLDKMHYGATSYSLIHAFSELYGGQYSCRLLSSFSRLFTSYLQLRGFTLGVEDILVTPQADRKRREIISRVKTIGDNTAAKAVGVEPEVLKKQGLSHVRRLLQQAQFSRFPLKRMTIDREYKTETDKITNEVNKACIPNGLHKMFPDNNLSLMIQSGAKGSSVNAMQISCLLGQIELEGKRPPLMISGRSLPSFVAYDTSPRAGGFISGRFMTGIRPQEFFYHCMAGREGLIDTAVKTSRSGYLQRCLIKHLEGVKVAYDNTVRDSDGTVLQFLYGEDGLDICKSQYLNDKGIPFLVDNLECIKTADVSVSDESARSEVEAAQKAIKRWAKKHGSLIPSKERKSGFLKFSSQFEVKAEYPNKRPTGSDGKASNSRPLAVDEIVQKWREMPESEKKSYLKKYSASPPEPVNAHYPLASHLDVLDENLSEMVSRYLDRPDAAPGVGRNQLTRLVYSKSIAASCEPGEAVGLLAAQSIGEPSTQMTLNTFHFAGRGEMNVTLGIPRLREILTVASKNISTPSMDIPLLKKGPAAMKEAEKLKLKLTKVTLADVLENVVVTESYSLTKTRNRIYSFTFNFLPHSSYKDRFCVKPKQVLRYFETYFVEKILLPGIKSEAVAQSSQSLFVVTSARKPKMKEEQVEAREDADEVKEDEAPKEDDAAAANSEESESDSDEEDTEAAKPSKRKDEREYDDEEKDDGKKKKLQQQQQQDGSDDEGIVDTEVLDAEEEKSGGEEEDDEGAVENNAKEAKENVEEEWAMTDDVEKDVESRVADMMNRHATWINDYSYDSQNHLHCRLTLAIPLCHHKVDMSSALKKWAQRAVVHSVPNINRAFVIEPKSDGDDVVIKTDGVNIQAMFNYADVLDLNRLYCNDIHAVVAHYGVEAASRIIVKEVRNVFKVYGITVDPRHLTLIASFMTSGGGYRAFSRLGMNDCSSPLQQISFETATEFLKTAVMRGRTDYLKNPSSRLVMGLPGLEGTGSFGLMAKLY